MGRYLHLGKGEEKTGGRTKQTLLVDAFEAILGAMYLDSGLEAPRKLIERFVGPQISEIGRPEGQFSDFKTALQELLQSRAEGPCSVHAGRAKKGLLIRNYSPFRWSLMAISLLRVLG